MNWRTRCTKYSPTCPLVFTSRMTYRTVLTTGRDENTSCPVGTEYTISYIRRRKMLKQFSGGAYCNSDSFSIVISYIEYLLLYDTDRLFVTVVYIF